MQSISEAEKALLTRTYSKTYYDNISDLFRLICTIVERSLNKTRPGILIGLVNLGFDKGNFIGGFHYSGTNEIFLNKSALNVMKEESPHEYYKAYIVFVLLHEYIHAVGVQNEYTTRVYTKEIILTLFGFNHPLSVLAINGPNALFPYSFIMKTNKPTSEELIDIELAKIYHSDSEMTYT